MTITEEISPAGLPGSFADLDVFAEWIIEGQDARYDHRLASNMTDMQAFYDAAFPRLQAIIDYCNEFPIDDLPDHVNNLMLLAYSLIQISFPVEVWRQGRVPDSGSAIINCIREPLV